jgi:erythromycin esterase
MRNCTNVPGVRFRDSLYYRTMIRADSESWNIRDRHMVETLERLMTLHGPHARAIVWEHNTHVGDARATDMAAQGMVNVGQLVRQAHCRDDVAIVGFGSHRGTVIAGKHWDAPMQCVGVPPARSGTWEDVFHRTRCDDQLLLLDPAGPDILLEPRGHRAIGVVYDPDNERYGNYVPTILPKRYDAFIYVEESRAVHPLHLPPHAGHDPPETYPWGV